MLNEKEKEMLETQTEKRDIDKYGTIDIKDVVELLTLHSSNMTSVDETTAEERTIDKR